MNNPDHISESLKNFFGVKILKFFDVDPGSGIPEKSRNRDKHPGSATLRQTVLLCSLKWFFILYTFSPKVFGQMA
jgi:hypothetical protein